MHIPLPVESTSSSNDQDLIERAKALSEPVPPRSIRVLPEGSYVYVVQVRQRGGNISSIVNLAHRELFNNQTFSSHLREACKICDEVRMIARRNEMVKRNVAIKEGDVNRLNDNWFVSDADFVAAVMCDKWGYQIQKTVNAVDEIDPTIKR